MDLDEFSDDGLDDLPANALQALEDNAIQFTQAHPAFTQQRQPSQGAQRHYVDYGWEEEDDDLDTTEVTNDVGVPVGRPVVDKTLQQQQQRQRQAPLEAQIQQRGPQSVRPQMPHVPNPQWNPNLSSSTRPGVALAARPGTAGAGQSSQNYTGSQRFPGQTQGLTRPPPSQFAVPLMPSQAQPGGFVSALQQRVRALEGELNSSRGETAILRANSAKAQQEFDAQISRLKKLNVEQAAKHEQVIEAATAAEKSANTELQFMQQDMKEISDRARRKDTAAGLGLGMTTPKKTAKTWGFADGFDDVDIAVSPSKGQGRSRVAGSVAANIGERTPTKGKRKRPLVDSPIMALETHTGDVEMSFEKSLSQVAQPPVVITAPTAPFEFIQLVLDHGFSHQQPPTFDILSRICFPSDPTATSFSTLIFERLPLMGNPRQPMQLLVDFAEHVIILWTKCFEKQFWEPVKYLASLIAFTFQLNTTCVAPLVMPRLVPVAQSTMFTLVEGPQRLPDGTIVNNEEYNYLKQHIDTVQILSLLYTTAVSCATTPSETEEGIQYTAISFWRLISLDVILLLLLPKQKLADVVGTLELLATSSLPDSIGPVSEDKEPTAVAQAIIDRVSAKLTEHPRIATKPEHRRTIRLAALQTLIAFARHSFGARQLATHENTIPRLVTCLSTSIDELYDQPIPSKTLPTLPNDTDSVNMRFPESTASVELCQIISQCVHLLHTLVTDPSTSGMADVAHKLSMSHGGSQRYLIALGRLTFAEEDLVIEAGIDGDVVEAAHELLELAVTPDEGEIISEAFGA